jgi:type I restriction enzyme, R subunit
VFGEILESLFIERMDLNEDLFARYLNDPEFKEVVAEWLGRQTNLLEDSEAGFI